MGLKFRSFIYITISLNISINTDVTFLSVFFSSQCGLMQYILQHQMYLKLFKISQTDIKNYGIIKHILRYKGLMVFLNRYLKVFRKQVQKTLHF